MNYLLLIYRDEPFATSATAERDQFEQACQSNDEFLRQNGYLLAAYALQDSQNITTLYPQAGQIQIKAGPHASGAGAFVGLYFIRARDLNEALRIATHMPQVQRGAIEVHPLNVIDYPISPSP